MYGFVTRKLYCQLTKIILHMKKLLIVESCGSSSGNVLINFKISNERADLHDSLHDSVLIYLELSGHNHERNISP